MPTFLHEVVDVSLRLCEDSTDLDASATSNMRLFISAG
jgi:hypothetical protein